MNGYSGGEGELTDYVDEPLLGTAQWMPPAKVANQYLFEEGDLWLGRNGDDERTPIGRNDSSHVLLCAKTRSGKGRALITNNLLLWPGSIFVNDPKGENASITAARRGKGSDYATESLGQKVCVLDSHETASIDPEYRAFYNPIAEIRIDDPDAETKAAIIAESCISSKDKPDPTWDNKAKTFFKTLILHIATDRFIPDEHRNLVTLRRFIVAGDFVAVDHIEDQLDAETLKANPPDGFMLLLEGMKANVAFDKIISDQAKSLMESYASQPKMWNSIRTSAEEHSDWIDDNRIRSVLRPGKFSQSFTADELQSRQGGISIYMCLPSSLKDYFSSWPRIVVNMMLLAAQSRGNEHPASGHQSLMMLDEFASMERMKRIETAAADIAGAGVKLFFVVQNLAQLKSVYGENWETFASSADTHIYYGFNDNFTAEYVSNRLGEVEVIRRLRSQSRADNTTTSDGTTKGGSSSIAEGTADARSKGGGKGKSDGTSDTIGWGPSILFRTLATTNQSGRNYGSSRQSNWQKTKTKNTTKSEGTNWGETSSVATGVTLQSGMQESLHKKPLAAINELMRLFGEVEDVTDPSYPGIGLVSKASGDPMLIHKCHYDEDRFFEGLFDPHPKWGFKPIPALPKPPLYSRKIETVNDSVLFSIGRHGSHHKTSQDGDLEIHIPSGGCLIEIYPQSGDFGTITICTELSFVATELIKNEELCHHSATLSSEDRNANDLLNFVYSLFHDYSILVKEEIDEEKRRTQTRISGFFLNREKLYAPRVKYLKSIEGSHTDICQISISGSYHY